MCSITILLQNSSNVFILKVIGSELIFERLNKIVKSDLEKPVILEEGSNRKTDKNIYRITESRENSDFIFNRKRGL